MRKYNLTLLIALTFIAKATQTLGSEDPNFGLVEGTALGRTSETAPMGGSGGATVTIAPAPTTAAPRNPQLVKSELTGCVASFLSCQEDSQEVIPEDVKALLIDPRMVKSSKEGSLPNVGDLLDHTPGFKREHFADLYLQGADPEALKVYLSGIYAGDDATITEVMKVLDTQLPRIEQERKKEFITTVLSFSFEKLLLVNECLNAAPQIPFSSISYIHHYRDSLFEGVEDDPTKEQERANIICQLGAVLPERLTPEFVKSLETLSAGMERWQKTSMIETVGNTFPQRLTNVFMTAVFTLTNTIIENTEKHLQDEAFERFTIIQCLGNISEERLTPEFVQCLNILMKGLTPCSYFYVTTIKTLGTVSQELLTPEFLETLETETVGMDEQSKYSYLCAMLNINSGKGGTN